MQSGKHVANARSPALSVTLNKNSTKLPPTRIDPTRFARPNAGAVSKLTMAHDGQIIDDNYINQKIMYLNQERMRIHDIAQKYGLVNNVKVVQLQLIQGASDMNGPPDRNNLQQITDQKDRIQEYHNRVNEKRKKIHEKQLIKKKE